MPATTFTTRLGLRKPDPDPSTGDFINPVTDINQSMDKLDAAIGFTVCTSGTRPTGADRWDGRNIIETDTLRSYVWSSALTTWLPLLVGRGTDGPYLLGQSTDTGGEGINARGSVSGADLIRFRVTTDTQVRLTVEADGFHLWGSGAAVGDTNLYRAGVDHLKTDDAFTVGGVLTANSVNVNTHLLGGWTTYTPVWTSITGSNPSIGNGTLTARWRRTGPNQTKHEWYLVGGSSTNWGTGVYALSLGVGLTATATSVTHSNGNAFCVNNLAQDYVGGCRLASTTTIRAWFSGSTNWGQTGPFTFGTDDKFSASMDIEVT